jgi:hypothetical protein
VFTESRVQSVSLDSVSAIVDRVAQVGQTGNPPALARSKSRRHIRTRAGARHLQPRGAKNRFVSQGVAFVCFVCFRVLRGKEKAADSRADA